MYNQYINSPCGPIRIDASESGITAIQFVENALGNQVNEFTELAAEQLQAYFDGHVQKFTLPLVASGTDFQKQVWAALMNIGYGETASYADIARAIGNPKAVRAVGAANGRNPIAIVVPCHRIIGTNGRLTGYAGGLSRKHYLLELEGASFLL